MTETAATGSRKHERRDRAKIPGLGRGLGEILKDKPEAKDDDESSVPLDVPQFLRRSRDTEATKEEVVTRPSPHDEPKATIPRPHLEGLKEVVLTVDDAPESYYLQRQLAEHADRLALDIDNLEQTLLRRKTEYCAVIASMRALARPLSFEVDTDGEEDESLTIEEVATTQTTQQ